MKGLTLEKVSSVLKSPWFLIALIIILGSVMVVALWLERVNAPKNPIWMGIEPGSTTLHEVKSKLGEPKKTQKTEKGEIYGYPSDLGTRLHEVHLESQTVIMIKEQVGAKDQRKMGQITNTYGEADKFYSEMFGENLTLFVYSKFGIAVLANPATGDLFEVWYFETTVLKDFFAKFGKGLTTTRPLSRDADPK